MRKILLTTKEQRLYFFTKVVPLLRVGLSIRDISKVLDKTTTTIRTYNKQYGSSFDKYNAAFNGQRNRSIKNRSLLLANNKALKYYKQIINFIQKGYTQRQISNELQIHYFTVKNILKRQKDKDNLYIMLQNGLKHKEIIRQQNVIKMLQNKQQPNWKDIRLLKNKKYYLLVERLIRQGLTFDDICTFLKRRNINIGYYACKSVVKEHGTKSVYRRGTINGLISLNKSVYTDHFIITKCKTSKAEIRFRDVVKKLIPKIVWQHELKVNDSRYFLDLALPEQQIGFEYDGYWHQFKIERDKIRDLNLTKAGWKIIRFQFFSNTTPSYKKLEIDFLNKLKELDLLYLLT